MAHGSGQHTAAVRGLHAAIIMDGNGRWAVARGKSRTAGHLAGADAVRRTVEAAPDAGIDTLTLYAFSSDNWRRPPDEVGALMRLLRRYLMAETGRCVDNGVRVQVIGRRDRLAASLVQVIESAERMTARGAKLHLRIAVDYSARDAILLAARRLFESESHRAREGRPAADARHPGEARQHRSSRHRGEASRHAADGRDGRDGRDAREGVDPLLAAREQLSQILAGCGETKAREVDLLIRTGGEKRLSDFLLWECAYAELIFTERMWPDFGAADLADAVCEFYRRERRFGCVKPASAMAPDATAAALDLDRDLDETAEAGGHAAHGAVALAP
jgi:undecaprenyl diphosphate synthase